MTIGFFARKIQIFVRFFFFFWVFFVFLSKPFPRKNCNTGSFLLICTKSINTKNICWGKGFFLSFQRNIAAFKKYQKIIFKGKIVSYIALKEDCFSIAHEFLLLIATFKCFGGKENGLCRTKQRRFLCWEPKLP